MGEFKFIEGPAKDIQKVLNQWKHDFLINPIETQIISFGDPGRIRIAMLLWRKPLNSN